MSNLLDFRNMDGLDNGLILNGYGLVSLSLCLSLPVPLYQCVMHYSL